MAASRFFATVELLEYLLALPELISDIARLQRISKQWHAVVHESSKLNWRLFDRPKSRPSLAQADIGSMAYQAERMGLRKAGFFAAHPVWDEYGSDGQVMWPEGWIWPCLLTLGDVRWLVARRHWNCMQQYAFQPPVTHLTISVTRPDDDPMEERTEFLQEDITDPTGLRLGRIVDALRFLDTRALQHEEPWALEQPWAIEFQLELRLPLNALVDIGPPTSLDLQIRRHTPAGLPSYDPLTTYAGER